MLYIRHHFGGQTNITENTLRVLSNQFDSLCPELSSYEILKPVSPGTGILDYAGGA